MSNDATATTPSPVQTPVASATVGGAANDSPSGVSADPSSDGQSGVLPEKFRGPDGISKMAQAYTESERELRKAQEERAAALKDAEKAKLLEQQIELMRQQQVTTPVHTASVPNEDEIFMKEWEEDPARAVLNQNRRAESRVKSTVLGDAQKTLYESMKADKTKFPDFEAYEPEMIEASRVYSKMLRPEALSEPGLIPLLYNIVAARHIGDKVKSAAAKAVDEAEAKRAAKESAAAEGGGVSNGSGTKTFSDLSLKEMENLLGFVDR